MFAKLIKISCAIAIAVALAGCGSGGGDDTTSPPPPPPASTGIGAAGGTVTGPSGAQVVVPAGALTTPTAIVVAQSSTGAPALPNGVTPFGPIIAFTPHGTTFAVPVAITVPFDPALVPVGTTPVLYKTDATQSTWELVSGATVNGSTMTGSVSGFSFGVAASPPVIQVTATQKRWQADSYTVSGRRETVTTGTSTGELVNVRGLLGPPLFLTPLGIPADIDSYWIHSNESGRTFWTQAVAPNEFGDPSRIGTRSTLSQTFYFQVNQQSPTLNFVITKVELESIDGGGNSPSNIFICPWLPSNPTPQQQRDLCVSHMSNAEATFHIEAHSFADHGLFFRTGGEVEVTGIHGDWRPLVTGDLSDLAVWNDHDFSFDIDVDDHGDGRHFLGVLLGPKTVQVPIAHLHPGDIFSVEVDMKTTAINHIQGESFVSAFIRDPLQEAGLELQTAGLTQIEPRDDIPSSVPPLSCTTGVDPAAGVLQFSAPTFSAPESSDGAAILIERTGGTTGAVGVRIETHDASAQVGGDYEAVSTEVRFADGEGGQRRVEVIPLNDDVAEDDETVNLVLSNVGGCGQLGAQASATLTILDDDRPIPVIPTFAFGGTVTGLAGSGLVLHANILDQVQPVADGPFSFPRHLEDGAAYTVSVATQPTNPAQICTVTNGSGTIAGADITNILVNCTTPPPSSGVDTGFGSQGKVFTTIGGAHVLNVQTDGKLLALGNLTLSRYNADGSIDAAFGSGGTVNIPTNGGGLDKMTALTVQADGKIVVVGGTSLPTVFNDNFITVRFNTDGSLDTSFGTGGRVLTDFAGHNDDAKAVMVQPDGRIVVAGNVQLGALLVDEQDFAVVRYLTDGTLDASFGTGGKSTVDAVNFGGRSNFVNAAALQSDGRIVVVGRVFTDNGSGNSDMGIARFLGNGSVDTGFGTQGVERIDFGTSSIVPLGFDGGGWDEALDVVIQGDGKILVGGYTQVGAVFRAALVRLLSASGALDFVDFGTNGMVISSTTDKANGIALQADGRIVIAGTSNADFGIERFTSAGVPDATFGTNGLLTIDFFGAADAALDMLIQPDGKIVAGGTARNGASGGVGIARVLP